MTSDLNPPARQIPPGAPAPRRCLVCDKGMPEHGKKCTECDSFQDWRRYVPFTGSVLSLLVALVSVTGLVVPVMVGLLRTHSTTSFRVVGMDRNAKLLVGVGNTGGAASTIRKLTIHFSDVQLERAILRVDDAEHLYVPSKSQHIMRVTPEGLELSHADATCKDIRNDLSRSTIAIIANVQESNDSPTAPTPREATGTGDQVVAWLDAYLPICEQEAAPQ